MSELRWHPFLQEWVITATHRQDRTFFPPPGYCPLCPTSPGGFPTEIRRDTYDIAVFENKFPSLATPPPIPALEASRIVPVGHSEGVCEVVCYTPEHDTTLADLPLSQISKLVRVWKDRYEDLISRKNVKYVFIFENKGREIGVTLAHPHGQIYAYPFVPKHVGVRHEAERLHMESTGTQLSQDWLDAEVADGRRIVARAQGWTTVVPSFARYPYELHLVPDQPVSTIGSMEPAQLDGFALSLKMATGKLDKLFGFAMPYIMCLFQHDLPYSRFRTEIYPPYRTPDKLKYLAGSEAGAGVFINDTLPEETAAQLRDL